MTIEQNLNGKLDRLDQIDGELEVWLKKLEANKTNEQRTVKEIIEEISMALIRISNLEEKQNYTVSVNDGDESTEKEISSLEEAKILADAVNKHDIYELLILLGYDDLLA